MPTPTHHLLCKSKRRKGLAGSTRHDQLALVVGCKASANIADGVSLMLAKVTSRSTKQVRRAIWVEDRPANRRVEKFGKSNASDWGVLIGEHLGRVLPPLISGRYDQSSGEVHT